jgi:hypothetical protein
VGVFALLALLFWAAKFDTSWMREHAWFIIKGVWVTIFSSVKTSRCSSATPTGAGSSR